MLAAILTPSIILFYILVAMCVFRRIYVLRMREFLRWQNEDPDQQLKYQGYKEKPRSQFTYTLWLAKVCKKDSPGEIGCLWIFYALCLPIYKWCHPTVKVPNQTKIKELENL